MKKVSVSSGGKLATDGFFDLARLAMVVLGYLSNGLAGLVALGDDQGRDARSTFALASGE